MTGKKTYEVPYIYTNSCIRSHAADAPLTVSVPGSKSITNRALLLATLAKGSSTLHGVLFSDDSRHFLSCLQSLGFETDINEKECTVTVKGLGGMVPRKEAELYVGSAGTAARFLTAYLGVSKGLYHMDASEQMRRRPMAPLLNSLRELGCEVIPDCFPFDLKGNGFQKNTITVNIDESSQFLSALMISSCLADDDFTVTIEGSHGMAYIEMTQKMMAQFGVTAEPLYYCNGNGDNHDCTYCVNSSKPYGFRVAAGQHYKPMNYQVEPDVSAACYFYAMSPLLGVPVRVQNVHFDSLQGDVEFIRILERMGCQPKEDQQGVLLLPPADGIFHGITADMSACSDQAITLAAIAPFADSPTTITGIGHIRYQESDRLNAIVTELGKLGIRCESTETSVTIYPGSPCPSLINTYEDHRMAMGFSLIGLRSPGIVIDNPDCCRKTFENYFEVLEQVINNLQ
ncbi:MAG: 3-phosphoshikimate 1-carboxyvinyltransferase [Acetatifactor sp.]